MKLIIFWIIIFLSLGVLAECENDQIDINDASTSELDELVWVGPATAEKIVDSRPFDSVDDLIKVRGIGEKKLEDIIDEGLACVEEDVEEDVEDGVIEKKKSEEESVEKIFEDGPVENEVIHLNSGGTKEEAVYESKESIMLKYAPYAFVIFCLVILGGFVISR